MIRRFLLLALLLVSLTPALAAAKRDPLAPLRDMPQAPVASLPGDLFMPTQIDAMSGNVNEAREFGVPLAVRVISLPTGPAAWYRALPLRDRLPSSQEIVQRMAESWLAGEPIESAPGAADGILLFVVVPENDHTQAMAAFATDKNALPLNGLTQQSLETVLDRTIRPFFRNGSIGDGIRTGVAMLSYDNLFARPARRERSHQQETLFTVTNTALLGLTLVASLALVAFAWWVRHRHGTSTGAGPVQSPFEAGALLRGRVDDAVVAAALVDLVLLGALVMHDDRIEIAQSVSVSDPFQRDILDLLERESSPDRMVSDAARRRIQDVLAPARTRLENRLAAKGLLIASARVESVWVLLASALTAVVTIMALVPSIASMSRLGLGGILLAVLTIAGVLVWTAKRSWTSPTGEAVARRWLEEPRDEDDVRIVDTIINQDALLDTPGGPDVLPVTRLVRDFRALGAG